MWNSVLQKGLCGNKFDVGHTCHNSSKWPKEPQLMYTFDQGDETNVGQYLISPEDVRNAIAHQYWLEETPEESNGETGTLANDTDIARDKDNTYANPTRTTRKEKPLDHQLGIRQAMSFAESVLSAHASTASVTSDSSAESSVTSFFSAITSIVSNANKYGIPATPSPTRRKNKSVMSSSKDRYNVRENTRENNDWDYGMAVMAKSKTAPRESYVLHLKTIAHMCDFYRDEFLLSFPQYPVPKEMAIRKISMQSNWKPKPRHGGVLSAQRQLTPIGFSPIQLAIDNSSFLDICISGSLGLVTSRKQFSQLASIRKRKSTSKDFLILGDRQTNKPLMVCSLKSRKGKPVVRIFAAKPRSPEQASSVNAKDIGLTAESLPLYTWAEIKTEGEFPDANAKYSFHTSTGIKNKFHKNPLYTAIHESEGLTELHVFGRKEDGDLNATGDPFHCARVCVRSEFKMCEQETNYVISIVKGVEFANILAMVAIIDELIEFNMRKKCAMLAWKFTNKV